MIQDLMQKFQQFTQDLNRHEKMSALDPRDTNKDGVVSQEEAAAYIRDYLGSASPEERNAVLKEYFGHLSPEERKQLGEAIVKSPANPVQSVRDDSDDDLVEAYTRTATAPAHNGKSPLEAAFAEGGALSSPIAKAGLVGLAAMIGSKMLGQNR